VAAADDGQGFVVTDRRGGLHERAFGKEPRPVGAAQPVQAAPVTASELEPTADAAAPVIVDGDAIAERLPQPTLTPAAWDGWPDGWAASWSNVGGAGARAGDPALSNRVSTVFTCVDLNGSALGSMPVALTERGRPLDPETYDWTTNPEPLLYSSWDEFVGQVYASLGTRGDAYVHATAWDYDTFLPSRFMVLDPDQVSVQFDADGIRRYTLNGEPLFGPDVLHLRYLTIAGWANGLSPLQGAAGNLRSAGALERYGADLASRGGLTWGVLSSDARITERQAQIAQDRWTKAAQHRRGAPAVLGNGLKLETLTLSPKDMALLELRIFDEQRISSCYGVPPFLVGLDQPGGMTYSNVTSLFDFHWRRLRPVAKRLTNALSAWALPRGRKVHLNAGDYVQPDLGQRATAYKTMADAGALTVNEWRAVENLPPIDGGDVPTAVFLARLTAGQGAPTGDSSTVAAMTAGTATLQ
jgi:HK97 family phage portal protein